MFSTIKHKTSSISTLLIMAMFLCPGNHWTSCSTNGSICVSSSLNGPVEHAPSKSAFSAFDSCKVCARERGSWQSVCKRGGELAKCVQERGGVGGPGIFNKNVRGAHRKGAGESKSESDRAHAAAGRGKKMIRITRRREHGAGGKDDPRIRTRISAILLAVESDAASAAATVEPGSGRTVDFLRNLFMVALALTGTSERRKGEKEKKRKGEKEKKKKNDYINATSKTVNRYGQGAHT